MQGDQTYYQDQNGRNGHSKQQSGNQEKNPAPVHTVFFFNINFKINFQSFRNFCEKFGEIANIYGIRPKGIYFVTYYDIRNAKRAVDEAPFNELYGRPVKANYAYKPGFAHTDPELVCSTVEFATEPGKSYNEQQIIQAFGPFGEMRQIRKDGNRFIVKYFDIRSAKKAMQATQPIKVGGDIVHPYLKLDEDGMTDLQDLKKRLEKRIEKIRNFENQVNRSQYNQFNSMNADSSPEGPQQAQVVPPNVTPPYQPYTQEIYAPPPYQPVPSQPVNPQFPQTSPYHQQQNPYAQKSKLAQLLGL